jgi:hypothetical protein
MSYDLSFAEDFFDNEDSDRPSRRPTSVMQALESMAKFEKDQFDEMIGEVLGAQYKEVHGGNKPVGETVYMELMDKVRKTNTCSNLNSPVEVWIDEDGNYKVDVYDSNKTAFESIHNLIRKVAEEVIPLMEDSKMKSSMHSIADKYTKGMYSDDSWHPVHEMHNKMNAILPLESIHDEYSHDSENRPNRKTWTWVGVYKNRAEKTRVCWVHVTASGAGSQQDPLDRYDLTVAIEALSPKTVSDSKVQEYLKGFGIGE